MEEIIEIIKMHREKYPLAKPQDYIKLIYQNEFGAEHAIDNEEESLANLIREVYETKGNEEELFVPIGNHLVRLNIHVAIKQYSVEDINGWFVRSAKAHTGSMANFLRKIKTFEKMYEKEIINLSKEELKEYLSYYRSKAYPAVHHSDLYRKEYEPHYRVIQNNSWK